MMGAFKKFQSGVLGQRKVWAWAAYDWANSAFATTVMAGFFPLFFKKYWAAGMENTLSTAKLGFSNSMASVLLALLAPFLGALADSGSNRKFSLGVFTLLGVLVTAALFWVPQGAWKWALFCYVLAYVGYSLALVFYDSLLQNVSDDTNVDVVSSLGYGLGYLGGGVLFSLNVFMFLKPAVFGFSGGSEAIRFSFLTVALWWALFTLPLMREVKEAQVVLVKRKMALLKESFSQLKATFSQICTDREVSLFLMAYWLYMDGVGTIFKMSVDFGLSIGLGDKDLIGALLLTQFVGFPSAIAFGYLGKWLSPKNGILMGIAVYLGVVALGTVMTTGAEFYLLATMVGLVQGGVQALSRSLFTRLVPENRTAEYFGFFNIMGRFVSFIGPFLISMTGLLTHNSRYGILPIGGLFLLGGFLLTRVKTSSSKNISL